MLSDRPLACKQAGDGRPSHCLCYSKAQMMRYAKRCALEMYDQQVKYIGDAVVGGVK